jgi:biopolymer transport protein ExbD
MRLGYVPLPRPQIPVIPLANIALLILTVVMITGMYSAPRGPGLRFARAGDDGIVTETGAVRVEVLSEDETVVDGTPVPMPGLAAAVAARLAKNGAGAVVLDVAPWATYASMAAAYGAIAGLPGPPKIAMPRPQRGARK